MAEDKRVTKTKALIRKAYLDSVREQGVRKTTVKEVCDRAYISRQTFYKHYETIEFLLKEIMGECLSFTGDTGAAVIHDIQVSGGNDYDLVNDLLLCHWKKVLAQADILRIFLNGKSPETELYIREQITCSLPKPDPAREPPEVVLAYELVCSEIATYMKFALFHPEMSVEQLSEMGTKSADTVIHRIYTNSACFQRSDYLKRSRQTHSISRKQLPSSH